MCDRHSRPDAFNSGAYGILGIVDKDRVDFYRAPVRRHTSGSEFDVNAITTISALNTNWNPVRMQLCQGTLVNIDGRVRRDLMNERFGHHAILGGILPTTPDG